MQKTLVTLSVLCSLMFLSSGLNSTELSVWSTDESSLDRDRHRDGDCCCCAPRVKQLLKTFPYNDLYAVLTEDNNIGRKTSEVANLYANQTEANYAIVLANALLIANTYAFENGLCPNPAATGPADCGVEEGDDSPRVVIAGQDGRVIVDTGTDDNTLENWQAGDVASNANHRISFLDAQLYPCGVGLETLFQFIDDDDIEDRTYARQANVAVRLGNYLSSEGTIGLFVTTGISGPAPITGR